MDDRIEIDPTKQNAGVVTHGQEIKVRTATGFAIYLSTPTGLKLIGREPDPKLQG